LLFDDAPKALIDKVEQVARLIRSKGIGVYFVTQNPADIPDDILGQMGNRIQHALRAFTPKDQKALKLAAENFRANEAFDTADTIIELGVGEALVSSLVKKGMPSIVQRTLIRPPSSQLGPITKEERAAVIASSHLAGVYEAEQDPESAYEILSKRAEKAAADAAKAEAQELKEKEQEEIFSKARKYDGYTRKSTTRSSSSRSDSIGKTLAKTMIKQLGTSDGRKLIRGVLGTIFSGN